MNELDQKIKEVLETVRPTLQMDGGDVAFQSFNPDTGCVSVQLQGACQGCPMSQMTLKMYIEQELKEAVPEVVEVRAV
ncbi:MAG: NifU family protein [Candidatus Falkowbacteria bacterium]